MNAAASAGLLMYRIADSGPEVLLVHPGGPFWARKDAGAWSIPKGEHGPEEDPLAAARREFEEETGWKAGDPDLIALGEARQKSGKLVRAWAFRGDVDPGTLRSNTFALEWPPRSGRTRDFPEIDRAAWLSLPEARRRIVPGQAVFLERLSDRLGAGRQRSAAGA
ncbi:MAG TPA: NUDIX domain-containing protein [Terriglobales bacterium]|nr:NUDIX domain-containing protein [Terriglobales bacterium]